MAKPTPSPLTTPQTARATARFGKRVVMEAEVRATPLGLLAVGSLVAAILLSVPPIIRASLRRPRLLSALPPEAPRRPAIELIAKRD